MLGIALKPILSVLGYQLYYTPPFYLLLAYISLLGYSAQPLFIPPEDVGTSVSNG